METLLLIILGMIGLATVAIMVANVVLRGIRRTVINPENIIKEVINYSSKLSEQEIAAKKAEIANSAEGVKILDHDFQVQSMIREHDKNFDTYRMLGYAKRLLYKITESWEKRELDGMRPFEDNNLYEIHRLQMNELIENNIVQHTSNLNIVEMHLTDYKKSQEYEYITVQVRVKACEWSSNTVSKQTTSGNMSKQRYIMYTMKFMRKLGIQTKENDGTDIRIDMTNCPNCGAPISINDKGACQYCGTIVNAGMFNWTLSQLDKRY